MRMVCVEQKALQLVFPEIRFQSGLPIQDLVMRKLRSSVEFSLLPKDKPPIYSQSFRLMSDILLTPLIDVAPVFTFEHHARLLDRLVGIIEDELEIPVEDSSSWGTGISKGNTPLIRAIRVRVDPSISKHYPFGPVILGQVISEADYLERSPDKNTAEKRIKDGWTLLESRLWVVPGLTLADSLRRNASPIYGVPFRELITQKSRFAKKNVWSA